MTQLVPLVDAIPPVRGKVGRPRQRPDAAQGDRGYTSAEQLLSEAWHDAELPQETVRTYIVRLRRKLAGLGAPVQVANVSRRGYSLVFDERSREGSYDSAT